MATYNPQSEIPVPLSMDEIEYLKALLRYDRSNMDEKTQIEALLNKSIQNKLDKVLPRSEMIHTCPQYEKYF